MFKIALGNASDFLWYIVVTFFSLPSKFYIHILSLLACISTKTQTSLQTSDNPESTTKSFLVY